MYFKHIIGRHGEDIATFYLLQHGYQIIERNYFCKQGEIDIIAKHDCEIVFFEVKTRRNNLYGSPIDSIDKNKRKHLEKAISYYVYSHHLENCFIRIDAIEIFVSPNGYFVHHIKQLW